VQHWLLFKKYTSIKQIVYIHLINFLSVYTKDEKILWIKKGKLPLYQGTDGKKILYISSVALQLASSDNSKVTGIIRAIAGHLAAYGELFHVKVVPPALIHIELIDSTLAVWLHNLTVGETRLEGIGCGGDGETGRWPDGENYNNKLFKIQYAHARCCSLLRLADREGLIQLIDNSTEVLGLLSTQPIPWLDCDQKLRLYQGDEVRLMHLLVKMVDDLVFPDSNTSVNWMTTALKLSEAFESFWCNCRIWGEVKINSLELAQARLGLLIVTQLVLRSVLESKLGVFAPVEL
jgi:hypothetical protein